MLRSRRWEQQALAVSGRPTASIVSSCSTVTDLCLRADLTEQVCGDEKYAAGMAIFLMGKSVLYGKGVSQSWRTKRKSGQGGCACMLLFTLCPVKQQACFRDNVQKTEARQASQTLHVAIPERPLHAALQVAARQRSAA